MKIESIKQMQDQLESIKRTNNSESDKIRREILECREKLNQKDETIANLHERCGDLIASQIIEIPIYAKNRKAKSK